MRIAFLSYWSCPLTRLGVLTSGGMNVYVMNLADNLGQLGHQVDIYTRVHQKSEEKTRDVYKNVRIIHLAADVKNHYLNARIFARSVLEYIQEQSLNYNILHAHYYYSGLAGLIIKRKLQIPLIQTFHTLGEMKKIYGGISDGNRIHCEMKIVRETDAIITSTELEQNDLIAYYRASPFKIYVVYPGVNHDIFKPHNQINSRKRLILPLKKKLILFVGRIDPVKGLIFFIESLVSLTIRYPEFARKFRVLLIGGDLNSSKFWQNKEVIKIKQLIDKEHLDCCIKFLGSKPHGQLPLYYSAADVVVMPSVYESFGLVVLEAMASSACVLAARVGGLSLLVKDKINGRLFTMGNSDDFNTILWELIHDSKQRKQLGRRALESSQKYCWDKQAKKILNVYNKLC